MKTYTKIHANKKAAESHLKRIKNRGGTGSMSTVKNGFLLEYSFPEKSPEKKKLYDVISPDGITIRIGVPPFKTIKASNRYFEQWAKRYKKQGYYSSNQYGRIPLEDLHRYCHWIMIDS